MEIDKVQVLKPFGPLVMMAQLPEGFIKKLNGIAEVVKEKGDMGPRLAGIIKKDLKNLLLRDGVKNYTEIVGNK